MSWERTATIGEFEIRKVNAEEHDSQDSKDDMETDTINAKIRHRKN